MSNFTFNLHTGDNIPLSAAVHEFGIEDRISLDVQVGSLTLVIFIPVEDRSRAEEISALFNGMTCARARKIAEAA